jgi:hypothetical protein
MRVAFRRGERRREQAEVLRADSAPQPDKAKLEFAEEGVVYEMNMPASELS